MGEMDLNSVIPKVATALPDFLQEHIQDVLTLEQRDQLLEEYPHVSKTELYRLGLLIWGVSLTEQLNIHRMDGVLPGIDLYLAGEVGSFDSRQLEGRGIDLDGGRIAVFQGTNTDTPFTFDQPGQEIIFSGEATGLRASLFPQDQTRYKGPYYLRTDHDGKRNRLVVNPHPNCTSSCVWCARSYPDRRKLGDLKTNDILSPQALMKTILSDQSIMQNYPDLKHLTSLVFMSGDFPTDKSVYEYLIQLSALLKEKGFCGLFNYTGHQIEDQDEIRQLKEAGISEYAYTVEHFDRRRELMPIKGKRTLTEVEQTLKLIKNVFGPAAYYYYIAGIDSLPSAEEGITKFFNIATPQVHVFTPYAEGHDAVYDQKSRIERLRYLLELQKHLLKLYGKPVPSGSNRSLFPLRGRYEAGKVIF